MNALELTSVAFHWPEMPMVFDLKVAEGDMVIVTGPSGSGKSTLLNLIAGFEPCKSGTILLDGEDCTSLPPSRRPVSMLFQEHNLFGHLSVDANVGFGIGPRLSFNATERTAIARGNRAGWIERQGKPPAARTFRRRTPTRCFCPDIAAGQANPVA